MTASEYDASHITVPSMEEFVLRRPGMHFRVGLRDPRLTGEVLSAVVGHALHPAAKVAEPHSSRVEVEIHADLEFSIADDRADALDAEGCPVPGYNDSLLGPNRYSAAAAAVLSAETVVEVWRDGRGFRQTLRRLQPVAEPAEFTPPPAEGTRIRFRLDPAYFTTPLPSEPLTCDHEPGAGYLRVTDLR
ncbi:hypothetical protein [Streptomyces acidiscabies]|uniref:Uncharacterized protein n=1 Tax=Streptomyces acidiscabies TaxID=42234 RepID=A0AAP6BAJ7_9ACTN|nr:hypothetical protein [Streptomyces acidiscabies]MBP5935677.1 hypothetical protein [Streptomyces sp. LBUM 1476]MBZ3916430.1 hypothetical protein [Streptomyces acidiscabies]MDX2961197.1 hypothetical protein [Streptomyces acidiscabies]MDX3022849.1 hypothetical protein [Streptomyces acidiscabies]MDX3791904.1 hypothetical protein [Streptomyces acidiscabies]